MNKNLKVNVDRPMFARVKYLVIAELKIATLFTQVLVMRHQMSCCWFLCLSSRLTCGFLETIEHTSSFVALYQPPQCSTSQVHNSSVTRVAGILRAPPICSRDILLQAKGDHL
jgi:hypothetical protein